MRGTQAAGRGGKGEHDRDLQGRVEEEDWDRLMVLLHVGMLN